MSIREEFEKAFKKSANTALKDDQSRLVYSHALWAAKWMAEYLAVQAEKETEFEYMGMIAADEIRQLAKELSGDSHDTRE